MKSWLWPRTCLLSTIAGLFLWSVQLTGAASVETICDATDTHGGLIVHVGCGDGSRTAQLRANERFLVHGLDTDREKVEQARARLHANGIYGPVSIDQYDGSNLPYVNDSVNLLIVAEKDELSAGEIGRVVAPRGHVLIDANAGISRLPGLSYRSDRAPEGWFCFTKPVPADVDQWTHFLHDASGNAVANDMQVGSPTNLRWVAGPRWCRSHEMPSSVGAVVTTNGRLFSILDEGPSGVFEKLPAACRLVARDAASGVLLWKKDLQQWQEEDGTGRGNRWNIHQTIPRRLIAEGDRVYVTLQFLESPVSVLDAATGDVIVEALEGTRGADELLLVNDVLIVKCSHNRSVGATIRLRRTDLNDTLAAIDTKTNQLLWQKSDVRVMPYVFAAAEGKVVYHDMSALICLDTRTGKGLWQVPYDLGEPLGGETNLLIADDVVLLHSHPSKQAAVADATKKPKRGGKAKVLTAFALQDGQHLWSVPGHRPWSAACTQPTDVFFAGGLVWCGNSLEGRDLRTGEVKKMVTVDELISPGHHYRCHRAKATDDFLILPKRGAEFVDLDGPEHMRNDWLRAPCFTGATPANGLLYIPPSQCFCYPGVKVSGYLAMSSDSIRQIDVSDHATVERGPAYGKVSAQPSGDADWPMYRRDGKRSGSTAMTIDKNVEKKWTVQLAATGTQPVVVGDRVWVAEKDAHRVRCLDAATGEPVWEFTAGGRVDSSPTFYNGLVLFGCCDGNVYCLCAADGVLVWKFRAAPSHERLVSYEQVESIWPVHGSVLVQDGVVYCAAGRSSFLDGGILAYALDAQTGAVKGKHLLEGPWPDITQDVGTPFAMEGALPDLFVSDGTDVYMQRVKFDAQLNRLPTEQLSPLGELDMGANHLVATGGFLDDTGFDRVYWMHSTLWPGFYFAQHSPKAGQLVVFDDTTTYAVKYFYQRFQWSPRFVPEDKGYLLFADDNANQPDLAKNAKDMGLRWLPEESYTSNYRRGGRGSEKGTGYIRREAAKWQEFIPVRVRAMVLAGSQLIVAGPPDALDPGDPTASFEGRQPAMLNFYSTADGSLVNSHKLAHAPVFDGLSAADGCLYLATVDGRLICFGK